MVYDCTEILPLLEMVMDLQEEFEEDVVMENPDQDLKNG